MASVILLAVGTAVGATVIFLYPELAYQLEDSLSGFVKMFRGLPKLQLAAAVFFNNALKTLVVILLGPLLGVIAMVFLVVNGAALGIALYLSTQSRGLWLSLLAILPHGVLELPAVLLGTSIGLMLGRQFIKKFFTNTEAALGTELGEALKFFLLVIVPLLMLAALVEVFITPVVAKL